MNTPPSLPIPYDASVIGDSLSHPFKEVVVARKIIDQVTVDLKISLYDNGAVDKPVLVFIHGIGACKETFLETGVIQAFAKTHRVVALDLPGHGRSTMIDQLPQLSQSDRESVAAEYYSLPGLITQLGSALKTLKVSHACIFGWSIGGHITHGLAIKYPDLVERLITTGTPSINYAEPAELKNGFSEWFVDKIIPDWLSNPKHYSREESEAIIQSMGYLEVKDGGRDVYVVDALMNSDPLFRKYLYATLSQHADKPELYGRKFLEENRSVPLCLIEGEDDAGCDFKKVRSHFVTYVKGNHADSRLHSFEKTGHAVFRTRPEEFISLIKQFHPGFSL